ncbi:MAG: bifunctional DNA primase/polymerase, partial [Bacteroidales bacterium]|nr:bifunctional DNA primase/polymerase [Bacteroidales bacterium]
MKQNEKKFGYVNENIELAPLTLSIIPVNNNKTPIGKWKPYQSEISPISNWREHFCNGNYIGIITGRISLNLEVIDIDVKNDPLKSVYTDYAKLIPRELLSKLIIQTTPNAGYHFIFRCPDAVIDKSQELASTEDDKVIIETRGEGGYFCHHLKDYKVIQGKFSFVTYDIEIPEISPQERETLLTLARSLDRKALRKRTKKFEYNEPAIVEFNAKYDILELFTKHGWTFYDEDNDKVTLARPDSTNAYSGYYFKDSKTFICYSTSTSFKVKQPYNHFQILKVFEGEDDHRKTLNLLKGLGYKIKDKTKTVSTDEIAKYLNEAGVRYDSFRQDLIYNGEIITEMVYNTIFLDMKKHFGKEIARTTFEHVIKSNYIKHYSPIKDFINKYKDRHPDGTFQQWLDCIELQNKNIDPAVILHFFKKWFVGLISQALNGEYPNEFFLTFISIEQGIGKTTMLRRYTLPEELHDYVAEHALSYSDDFKVLMGQVMLIIDDEMDGRSYEMDKTFKTVLSTKELTTRRKYDRRISTIKRRCSFAGSGNNLQIVREQQNRRILPIEIEKIHFDRLKKVD